jgi:hypothetical protein
MGVSDQNPVDFEIALGRCFGDPVCFETGIRNGSLSRGEVSEKVAEIAISSEMHLEEMDMLISAFIYNCFGYRVIALHPGVSSLKLI